MAFSPGPPATLRPRSRWSPTSESAREPLLEVGEQLFTRVLAACSEIADDRHIALEVKAEDMKVSEALEARYQWHRDLFANCPAPLVWVFRLGLEIGS